MKENLAEIKTDDNSGTKEEEAAGESREEKGSEKKEIPLKNMKKADLIKEVDHARESAEKNYELYVRSQAEMDNLKKRFQKEKAELAKFSNEFLIKQLLPVLDNLGNAITHSLDEKSLEAFVNGVALTLKGLTDTLEKSGLEEVKAFGEPFDPNFHQAVSEQQDNTVKPGTVIQELQKGYTLNQRLTRPSMVIVSKRTT